MFEKTKALCDSFLEMNVPGFDLLVYKDGKEILRYMNGYNDRYHKTPVHGKELYNIFSCSKLMTCVAALQLWEKGLFRLEDPLCQYMPEFESMTVREEDGTVRPAKTTLEIHHLFSMTAGFNYDLQTPGLRKLRLSTAGKCPTREVARVLASQPLDFDPGTHYRYSLAHDVLAALVEVIAEKPFAQYVKENIFDPLGMTHSNFLLPVEEYRNVVPLYRGIDGTTAHTEVNPHYLGQIPMYRIGTEHASGGAGCVSTVEDYMKLLEAVRLGQILKPETVKMMAINRLTREQIEKDYNKAGYGYGLGVRVALPESGVWDFGWGGAAGAYFCIDPVNNICIYYAQHVVLSPNTSLRGQIYRAVLSDLGLY